jgi:hypothetical protein
MNVISGGRSPIPVGRFWLGPVGAERLSQRFIFDKVILGPDNLEIQLVEENIPLLIWRTIKGDFKE